MVWPFQPKRHFNEFFDITRSTCNSFIHQRFFIQSDLQWIQTSLSDPVSSPSPRLVLSSVSDYFAAMFTSDVLEAKQDEVKMEGVDPDALWMLVQYAYTGTDTCRPLTVWGRFRPTSGTPTCGSLQPSFCSIKEGDFFASLLFFPLLSSPLLFLPLLFPPHLLSFSVCFSPYLAYASLLYRKTQ